MTKAQLRSKYKTLRDQLNSTEIEENSLAIANQLLELDIWDLSFYHVFLSIKNRNEVMTDYILNILQGKDKNIVVSSTNFKELSMKHFLLTDSTLIKENTFHIPEPQGGIEISESQIDLVFVPLMAFDQKGNRVGYGKGFYDKFLSECNSNTIKIGLSFFEAEIEIEDVNVNDISLDYCVTPQRIYSFH